MKPRTFLLILLALVCGVSAAVGVNQLSRAKAPATVEESVTVVLATQDIPRGAVLSSENCDVRKWPKSLLPEGAVMEIEKAIDRAVTIPLVKGEPILEAKLSGENSRGGLVSKITPGMRAFTIRTPHVAAGVGGFVKPYDKVDVLLTTRSRSRDDGSGGGATTTLLQNVEVLAVDRRLDSPDGSELDEKDPSSVTLLVTPDQAAKLDLGMNMGTLHLSLRNPADASEAVTRPATLADLRYHQEKPLSNMAGRASQLAGKIARIFAGDQSDEDTQAETGSAAEINQYRSVNIRTLRGSSRGHIRIDSAR